jgi:hypothetical protein
MIRSLSVASDLGEALDTLKGIRICCSRPAVGPGDRRRIDLVARHGRCWLFIGAEGIRDALTDLHFRSMAPAGKVSLLFEGADQGGGDFRPSIELAMQGRGGVAI